MAGLDIVGGVSLTDPKEGSSRGVPSAEGMKAVVLCAGVGGRLRPLTDDRPKCLVEVCGRTILESCLENLEAAGIVEVVLVTGYMSGLVERHAVERSRSRVTFVRNREYARTNTAVSLNLALKGMNSDFVLVNGDLLFDRGILEDLLGHPSRHCLAVDTDISLGGEEVKVVVRDGRVEMVGKDADPSLCLGEAIGLNKIGRDIIPELSAVYDGLERRGELGHYFEKGFDTICRGEAAARSAFGVVLTGRRPWVEIDTLEDYEYAVREIAPRLGR
jgi:choline kinase